jgi:hypothetical protein
MGGVSSASQVTVTAEGLVFSGEVSLTNNGGFASIRARLGEYDLAGAMARPTRSPFGPLIPLMAFSIRRGPEVARSKHGRRGHSQSAPN